MCENRPLLFSCVSNTTSGHHTTFKSNYLSWLTCLLHVAFTNTVAGESSSYCRNVDTQFYVWNQNLLNWSIFCISITIIPAIQYMVCVFRNCLSKPFYEIIVIILNLTSIIIHSHNLYVLSSYHTEPHLTSIIIIILTLSLCSKWAPLSSSSCMAWVDLQTNIGVWFRYRICKKMNM